MAMEMHKQKTEEEKRELEMQRICETSEELKELERKIKTAYVNKERAAQHQEAMLLRKLENDREQAIEEKMEYDRDSLTSSGKRRGSCTVGEISPPRRGCCKTKCWNESKRQRSSRKKPHETKR